MAQYCGPPIRNSHHKNDPVRWRPDDLEHLPLNSLRPDPGNARKHDRKQIAKLVEIIVEFGFTNPILVDENNVVIAGHGRLMAAVQLGFETVACIRVSHLTGPQKKALAIADNAMSDASCWDGAALNAALIELTDVHFDLSLTGLETGAIDFHLDGPAGSHPDRADTFELPRSKQKPVSRKRELWRLGPHRLLCGNALAVESYKTLLGTDRAELAFTDCPFNVPVRGHISGLGRHQHPEFAMASGEMSPAAFKAFLTNFISLMVDFTTDGSIHYLFIDWRHIAPLLEVAGELYTELKNICVWAKTNAGMGSLYRSQHELIIVCKNGSAPHINNIELGRHGRTRSNVWDHAGANAFGQTRDEDLAAHPTVKPIALVADAIRDCSRRGGLVLDPFVGSGTTILACERSGRRAAAMEIDPLYVDVAIKRWQALTGKAATLDGDGRTFDTLASARAVFLLEDHSSSPEIAS
jgi:hypothetical protein